MVYTALDKSVYTRRLRVLNARVWRGGSAAKLTRAALKQAEGFEARAEILKQT